MKQFNDKLNTRPAVALAAVSSADAHVQFDSMSSTSTESVKDDDDWFIAGGSSGGSAVAVATGTVFV